MLFQPFYLTCLAHASYFIGDERTKTAVVVDPQRDVDGYVEVADRHGLTIRHVILTHFHADFVAGHLELAARTGATIHLGARARAEFAFSPLSDGQRLELGDVVLQALETPGHTPEGISILVFDSRKASGAPRAILTGDTLFIGDVGRPDLMASRGFTAEELAGAMYDSLRAKILPLADETIVYPAHGAGSACGKNISKETSSTLGVQRRVNWALQPMDRAEFVRRLTASPAPMPAYFAYDAQANREARATLDDSLAKALVPMSAERFLKAIEDGAVALDSREPGEWTAGHLAGSINVGLSGAFASWVGALIREDQPLVLVAPVGRERETALRLGRIGFDRVMGYLDGGFAALAGWPDRIRRNARLEPAGLARERAQAKPTFLLDVRTQTEWDEGHLAGAKHVPLPELEARVGELPRGERIAVHCKGGYRSVIALSLLERHGLGPLVDLEGGYMAWRAAALD